MRTEGGYPYCSSDAKIKELYGDIAYPDFNLVFKNQGDIVQKQYGETISVTVTVRKPKGPNTGYRVDRKVVEDMCKKKNDIEIYTSRKNQYRYQEDLQLQNLDLSLKNLEKEFGKTSTEIAEIFCLVSGRLPKVREYLQNEK